jgi:hypothetical protein
MAEVGLPRDDEETVNPAIVVVLALLSTTIGNLFLALGEFLS